MSVEVRKEESIGSLSGCLIEGDAEQKSRQRKVKRRALGISVFLQTAAVTAVVLTPLFAKPERIALNGYVPIPQYRHSAPPRTVVEPPPPIEPGRIRCLACYLPLKPAIVMRERTEGRNTNTAAEPIDIGPSPLGAADRNTVPLFDNRKAPIPPEDPNKTKRVKIGHLEPAMLQHRVNPIYPALMKQIGRSGQVELRAIISTDGSIESLQVVSGDPGFISSALEAVREWKYRPTYLNGKPVEVETIITVLYTLQR
jgi:protein TonB